jgi:hypothetical protein
MYYFKLMQNNVNFNALHCTVNFNFLSQIQEFFPQLGKSFQGKFFQSTMHGKNFIGH